LGLLHLQPPQKSSLSRVLAHALRAFRLSGLSLILPGPGKSQTQLSIQSQLLSLQLTAGSRKNSDVNLTPLSERGAIMLLVPLIVYFVLQFEKFEKRLFSGTIMLLNGAIVC